jgi:hypothetical protein
MLKRINDWYALRKYKGIIKRISKNDLMYKASTDFYGEFGKAALDCVLKTMEKKGQSNAESILVLPSGHGRELRFFKAHFGDSKIVACDIDKDGVDFCTKVFDVEGIYSDQDPKKISIPYKFDVIWCGSLVTHLPENYWRSFLEFFSDHLNDEGILIFSTHGKFIVEQFRSGNYDLGVDELNKERILKQYDRNGFGYGDYSGLVEYGISLSSRAWVSNLISETEHLQIMDYVERGWFDNHDTVACLKS